MISIDVKIHDEGIRRTMTLLSRRLKDARPLMRSIGEDVVDGVREHFERQKSPDGVPWKPSRRAIREGGETLRDTGTLYGSIHARAQSRRVIVGTNVRYAATMQYGAAKGAFGVVAAKVRRHQRKLKSGKIVTVSAHTRMAGVPWGTVPARPYLGISSGTWEIIRATTLKYLMGGING